MDPAASSSSRPRVLVVDDLELNRTLTETVLRGADYDVDSAADGASAVSADPWDMNVYEDWKARLGGRRVESFLARLLEQFRALRDMATRPAEHADTLFRHARDVASTGGILGFPEVTRCCRALEAAGSDAAGARAALVEALESAIGRLGAHIASRGSLFA